MRKLFYIILLQLVIATPQINLYFTNFPSDNKIQHDCLRVIASINESNANRQIISYCISESISSYNLQITDQFQNFTFAELVQQNITSQQLYLWSASIDIIEQYQEYLHTNNSLLENNIFYNCTLPRFGSICQYEFEYYHSNYSSLYHMIYDFYYSYAYQPLNITCYTHIECNRDPYPSCLDWSEICDGKSDCQDGIDEQFCWQLEINQCNDNEYRCADGYCISQSFYLDNSKTPDCLDNSDEHRALGYSQLECYQDEPAIRCEDTIYDKLTLTSSRLTYREQFLTDALYSVKHSSISDDCWTVLKCVTAVGQSNKLVCPKICENLTYSNFIKQICPHELFIPSVPVLFGDIYFAYTTKDFEHLGCGRKWFPYTCSNNSHYSAFFMNSSKLIINNTICYRLYKLENESSMPGFKALDWLRDYVEPSYVNLQRYTLLWNYTSDICNRSNMYQCVNSSKCISTYRLMNGITDCPYSDDEYFTRINDIHIIERIKKTHFYCQIANKYIAQSLVMDQKCHCGFIEFNWCEDENLDISYSRRHILFQTICDGYTELLPIIINSKDYTDETECELWSCDNIYTHCNGLWECQNGIDEADCYSYPTFNCSSDHHMCVSFHTNQLTCLPIKKANDGIIDCLGATDEPYRCYNTGRLAHQYDFSCPRNDPISCLQQYQLCNGRNDCLNGQDEQFCNPNRTSPSFGSVCYVDEPSMLSNVEQFLCDMTKEKEKQQIIHFSLGKYRDSMEVIDDTDLSFPSLIDKTRKQQFYCHRGLDLRLWLGDKTSITKCLCPPSYYGNQCQYQNERVSLSIQFHASSQSWQIPFAIMISLIDDNDERIIHSYEQFSYLSIRDCQIKFNIYLIYSTRSKNQSKSYAIHIDIYEKISLNYYGSLLFPIKFSFLPVHRLAFIVNIPHDNQTIETCTNLECNHGKCIKYSNNPQNISFCQCEQGWYGKYCNISHTCQCSPDSKCIGVSNYNQSVCVCPLHRFGPRCFLIHTSCSINGNSPCQNNGQCIPNDEYIESHQKFICICLEGFIGKRCEIVENPIIISFNKTITLPQAIFIHFIQVIKDNPPRRITTLQTIPFKHNLISIYWSQPFHIIFIELSQKNYYLTTIQNKYNRSTIINKTIHPLDRCQNISEIFNETFFKLDLIRRIKYYHIPCQKQDLNLSCFYDDIHFCLCQQHKQQRVANCFEFNHNMTFDCLGQSVCENDGQCFQDSPTCPQRSICVCSSCFYGRRCQFSTRGFIISLDVILGYHIEPQVSITQQPRIIHISMTINIIFMLIGLTNGILMLITFQNKTVRDVGCGIYLLTLSIMTLLTTLIFGLKFWILLLTQMKVIMNKSFISIQCHTIDFLLRIGLNIDQWLNACVAAERAITVAKSTRFDKKKSKQIAKYVILILLLLIIGTYIHDPIYRRLIDEENDDEKRMWCIVSYSSGLQTWNYIVNIFHCIIPFMLNLVSAIYLIRTKSRQKLIIQTRQNLNDVLREQIRQHKNLFIAPIVLVLLSSPSLIISFASKCMKSSNDSWLLLTGYYISFIPQMLTFIVFVLPSKFYKKEFQKTITQYRRHLHL